MSDSSTHPADSRSRWALALWILLAVTITGWSLICFQVQSVTTRLLEEEIFFSLLSFHACLLGIWLGMGSWPGRWLVAIVTGFTLGYIANYVVDTSEFWEFQTYTMGMLLIVAVTTAGLRFGYGDLCLIHQAGDVQAKPLQFNIKRIMFWTGGIAILFAVYRVVVSMFDIFDGGPIDTDDLPTIFGLALFVSIATVSSVWAVLHPRLSATRVAIAIVAIIAAAITLALVYDSGLEFAIASISSQLTILIVLTMLRKRGYRLGMTNVQ